MFVVLDVAFLRHRVLCARQIRLSRHVKMVNERKEYIDRSLVVAKEANEQLANLKAEGETIMAKAHEEQARILNEAAATRDRIIKEAKEQARMRRR